MESSIPNNVITVRENDAPWMTDDIKLLIKRKHRIFQRWKCNTSDITKANLTALQNDLTQMIDDAKNNMLIT